MAVNADAADDDLLKAKLRPRIKVGVGFGETRSFGKVWKLAADGVTLRADGKIEIGRKFQRAVGDVCEGRMKQKNQYSDKVTVARIKSLTSLVWQWCGNFSLYKE